MRPQAAPAHRHGKIDAAEAQAAHVAGPQAGVFREAEAEHSSPGQRCHRGHVGVIGVEDGGPVRGQALDGLRLGLRDRLDGAQALHVVRPNVHHDGDFWPRDLAQAADLPEAEHTGLEHGAFVPVRELEQGHREANLVVEVGLALEHRVLRGQQRGHQLLRRRLADAARYHDRLDVETGAPVSAKFPQSRLRVPHQEYGDSGRRFDRTVDQHAGGAGLDRRRHEVVAVAGLGLQSHEKLAKLDLARVVADAGEGTQVSGTLAEELGGQGRADFGQP